MTYIDEMIKELCPDGVEWKELGEVVDYEQPTKYIVKSKEYSDDYSVPVLTAGQTFILGYTNEETGIYPASKEHSVIIFDDFTTARKWVDFEFKVKSSAMKILSIKSECQDEVSIRYVWHYLGTIKYAPEQHARQWIGIFSKFKIPLPPLEIQQEIVKILDKFTEYVTELTAELTLRQKQYSYYRDRLLSFEDQVYQVEWKTLGEVCDVRDGTHDSPKKKNFGKYLITSKNIKCGSVTFENAYYISDEDFELINKRSKVDVDDLLFTMIGTVGEIAHIIDEPDFAIKNVGLIKTRDRILARYLFHYLQSSVAKKYIADNKSKGSQVFLALGKIRNFPIPYVPSDIQSRIVQVLDNFDTVCNDLNIGLPKEIELRQKQYDFFRDQLLTFTAEGVYTDSTVQYRQDLIRLLTWVFGPIRVELGAVCDLVRGNGLQKKDFVDNGVPCIHYGQIYTYYGLATDQTKSFVSPELAQKLKKASYGNVIVATTSENSEDVGKSLVWLGQTEACIGGHSCLLKSEQLGKYLVYYMQTTDFQRQKEKMLVGTKVIELYPKNLARIQFILPPLDQQKHIASILDRFDTLTTDLSQGLPAEIEQRQKQYEYWRDQLLQF
ncbi:type I restriction-modification system S protein [Streptococcus suis]|uniref:restriction endonuclease subunit S n=1 Tax=Streptococcus suis TaxID=1307 RepID=UPI0007694A3B|nr:restriction endonuclease subunit S [Streptococcus suis]CYW52637.1 type I restriction-modification system S protein [Streptococcus suis]